MRVVVVDTVYPEFLDGQERKIAGLPYRSGIHSIHEECFGTFDAWSRALAPIVGEAIDVLGNSEVLARKYCEETGRRYEGTVATAEAMVEVWNPEVVFIQDASFFPPSSLDVLRRAGRLLVGQISCPMPPSECVSKLDLCFTSFPHYVDRLFALGVRRVEYMPLAFDPIVLRRTFPNGLPLVRDLPVAFVGGVGTNLHWKRGTETLELVAQRFGRKFSWWGYGLERLASDSPLRPCYCGDAWGRKMYDVLARAKIVVNRHGEVANGCGNNLRQYESTGCGALLVTDCAGEFRDGVDCLVYDDAASAIALIENALNKYPHKIAESGRTRTLERYTYAHASRIVADLMKEMCRARR